LIPPATVRVGEAHVNPVADIASEKTGKEKARISPGLYCHDCPPVRPNRSGIQSNT